MIYLLDVNALVAVGFINHEFHDRGASWLQSLALPHLASCSITELGFVRVLGRLRPTDSRLPKPAPCCCASSRRLPSVSSSSPTTTMSLIFPAGSERPGKLPMATWANLRVRMAQLQRWTRISPVRI